MESKTNCHHYRSQEDSVHNNSPTMANFVCCSDVAPVMLFRAVQTYWPLSPLEIVWIRSTPLSGWLDTTGCPSRCHEKRAGGSESDMQVSCTVCPTNTSPPPTQAFGVFLVRTGVSGPSGSEMSRDCHQHSEHLFQVPKM